MEDLADKILSAGGVSSLMLAGVLYWLFKYYIPERDKLYKESMASQQKAFLSGMDKIVEQHKQDNHSIHARLDIIEQKVSDIK